MPSVSTVRPRFGQVENFRVAPESNALEPRCWADSVSKHREPLQMEFTFGPAEGGPDFLPYVVKVFEGNRQVGFFESADWRETEEEQTRYLFDDYFQARMTGLENGLDELKLDMVLFAIRAGGELISNRKETSVLKETLETGGRTIHGEIKRRKATAALEEAREELNQIEAQRRILDGDAYAPEFPAHHGRHGRVNPFLQPCR
jgi:hypothetical protein